MEKPGKVLIAKGGGVIGGHLAADFLCAKDSVESLSYSSSACVYAAEKTDRCRCGAIAREERPSGDARPHAASNN
jgi:hypothetical protein